MKAGVSIVVPALGPSEHLERALASLGDALALRPGLDEVIVVDDSGRGILREWVLERAPLARSVASSRNLGFAQALMAGVEAAQCALVFGMNSDLQVRPGFLEPLVDALAGDDIFAAVPRVLRQGDAQRVESLVRLELEGGLARVRQPCVEEPSTDPPPVALREPRPVPFALGGAFLARRADLLGEGGFDPLFEPFYLEDLDLGWRAWRAGRRCLHVPASVVEHANQGTIGSSVPRALALDAIERNQLLFQWKHLDGEALAQHLDQLERRALDAWLCGDRHVLEVLALALEQMDEALCSRAALPLPLSSFAELARRSDPFAD